METISEEERFSDLKNTPQIIEEIKNAETHDEVVDIINKTFPEWIIGWPKRYSLDYPHFQNNWDFECKRNFWYESYQNTKKS
jgi:hypothetical protein